MATGIWPTGRFAASGGVDRSVAVWDTRTGQAIAWIQTPHDRIEGVAASDDGTRRATTGSDGYVRVWDLRRGTQLWEVRHSADRLQFNVDGTRVAAGRVVPVLPHRRWLLHHGPVHQLSGVLRRLFQEQRCGERVARPLDREDRAVAFR